MSLLLNDPNCLGVTMTRCNGHLHKVGIGFDGKLRLYDHPDVRKLKQFMELGSKPVGCIKNAICKYSSNHYRKTELPLLRLNRLLQSCSKGFRLFRQRMAKAPELYDHSFYEVQSGQKLMSRVIYILQKRFGPKSSIKVSKGGYYSALYINTRYKTLRGRFKYGSMGLSYTASRHGGIKLTHKLENLGYIPLEAINPAHLASLIEIVYLSDCIYPRNHEEKEWDVVRKAVDKTNRGYERSVADMARDAVELTQPYKQSMSLYLRGNQFSISACKLFKKYVEESGLVKKFIGLVRANEYLSKRSNGGQ